MRLIIRRISLQAQTASSTYVADIPLDRGFNLIAADNTSGKSTALQAISYGLGLERMLGPNLDIPFAQVMRERIRENKSAAYETLVSSHVRLELENEQGAKLKIHRDVVGGNDRKLVRTQLLDSDEKETERDFFLHDKGSAQNPDGFHNFLCSFIGWDIPPVLTFDGREIPLYLEAIFPMLFVEQKRGWGVVQGPFPTHLRIQDVARRVIEFLIDLEDGKRRRRRLDLNKQLLAVQTAWSSTRGEVLDRLGNLVRLSNIPTRPNESFKREEGISIEVYDGDEWLPLSQAAAASSSELEDLEARELPQTDDVAPEIESELAATYARTEELGVKIEHLRNEMAAIREDATEYRRRVSALEVDLVRNQDALKLRRFGSSLGASAVEHLCPTCHQELDAELLPQHAHTKGMAIEENISFIRSQIELYTATASGSDLRANELKIIYNSTTDELNDKTARIRELQNSLRKPNSSPSRTLIERIVRLQAKLNRYENMSNVTLAFSSKFEGLASEAKRISEELSDLKAEGLTDDDKSKVRIIKDLLQKNLSLFHFSSVPTSDIQVSYEDFRPLALITNDEGATIVRELGFEMSGSDGIRMKWAYYLSLLGLSAEKKVNHPHLLIFDEPDQQAIEQQDLSAFLTKASQCGKSSQILVAATTEKVQAFLPQLRAAGANVVQFGGYVLEKVKT